MRDLALMAALVLLFAATSGEVARAEEPYPQLELALLVGATFPAESENGLAKAGPLLGAAALLRVGDVVALGLGFEHAWLRWDARVLPENAFIPNSPFPDDEAEVSHDLLAALVRFYFTAPGTFQGYGQAGLGYGWLTYTPEHPSCHEEDGITPQLALGFELALARALHLGGALSAHPSAWGLGCDDDGDGPGPRAAPYPGLLVGARVALTTLWDAR